MHGSTTLTTRYFAFVLLNPDFRHIVEPSDTWRNFKSITPFKVKINEQESRTTVMFKLTSLQSPTQTK